MTRWSSLWLIVVAAALPASGQNLLTNPGFDTGLAGWSSDNTSWIAGAGNPAGSGPGSIEVVAPLLNGGGYSTHQVVTVTPGVEYTISGWAFVPDSPDNPVEGAELTIVWLNNDNILNQSYLGVIADRGRWINSTKNATAPWSATHAWATFGARAPNSGVGTPRARWDDVYFGIGQPNAPGADYFIPAAAYSPGSYGTFWTTDVSIYNPLSVTLNVTASFFKGAGNNSTANAVPLPDIAPKATLAVTNIVQTLGGTGTGAVRIHLKASGTSEAILAVITARTWTSNSLGTFGQGTIASRPPGSTSRGASGVVQGGNFRTNIGVFNPTGAAVQARVRILSANGTTVYDQNWSLGAFGHRQEGLPKLGIGDLSGGTLLVDGAAVIAYITPADNNSGDAAYFEAQPLN